MRFALNIIDEYTSPTEHHDASLIVTFYSKKGEEHARDEAMGTDNPGIYTTSIFMPKELNDQIKAVEFCINRLIEKHHLNLNGEQPCQPNHK
jgi:hypothetical protein